MRFPPSRIIILKENRWQSQCIAELDMFGFKARVRVTCVFFFAFEFISTAYHSSLSPTYVYIITYNDDSLGNFLVLVSFSLRNFCFLIHHPKMFLKTNTQTQPKLPKNSLLNTHVILLLIFY